AQLNGSQWADTATTYDALGRVLQTTAHVDASTTRTTKTVYTPAATGPVTSVAVTNPVGLTDTKTYDPSRGTLTKRIDTSGLVSQATYDALGRVTSVWLPGLTKGTDPAT